MKQLIEDLKKSKQEKKKKKRKEEEEEEWIKKLQIPMI